MNNKRKKQHICLKCGKLATIHSKGLCYSCYKKQWRKTNNKMICKECGKLKLHHTNGLCSSCYTKLFHPELFELSKSINVRKMYNISYDLYKRITRKCVICGFSNVVALHHLDGNHKNNSEENLIGLCPNHHAMIHTLKFRKLILKLIKRNNKK